MSGISPLESEVSRVQERLLESVTARSINAFHQAAVTSLRRTQTSLLVVFATASLALTWLGCQVYQTSVDLNTHSVTTVATAKNIARVYSFYSFLEPYRVYYGYKAGGKTFTGTSNTSQLVLPGEKLTIKYMRSAPGKSFVPSTQGLATMIATFGGALICSLIALRACLRLKESWKLERATAPPKMARNTQNWPNTQNFAVPGTDVMPVRTVLPRTGQRRKT